MLSSKANAALMRVKEIETKYKLKRKEQKWNREQESDSPISSVSISPENLLAEAKKPLKNTTRPKLEIKMPNTRLEEDVEETDFLKSKNSSPDAINPKEENTDNPNLDAAISLENKSSPFIDKQESSSLTVTTVQENSSTKDEVDNSSKSFSRSKTFQRNPSPSKISQYEEKPIARREKTNRSDKSSRSEKETRSSASEKSRKIITSQMYFNSEERSSKRETAKIDQNSKRSDRSESSRDNTVVEESISTIEDVSEIIKSELSPVDETIADKLEDSVGASEYSNRAVAENASASDSSSSDKRAVIDSKYDNDTFENISDSSMRSALRSEKSADERTKMRDSARPSAEENNTSRKDASSYSRTLVATRTGENKRSPEITPVRQDGDQEDREKASERGETRESATGVSGSPATSDEDETASGKSGSSEEESEPENGNEHVLERDVDSPTHEDIEYAMRRLRVRNAIDALAKRHARETEEASESSSKSKSSRTNARGATKIRKKAMTKKEKETRHSAEKTVNSDSSYERRTKRRKERSKVTNVKSTDARDSIERRGKDGALKSNGRQMLRRQRRIVELRLREERETLQKYMNELRNSRPELNFSRTYFHPLELPNIAEFTEPGVIELDSVDQRAVLQERVLAIRRWMRDQYILYRDYCSVVRTINAHYTPTTLEDAKKTIRDLRKTTIKAR